MRIVTAVLFLASSVAAQWAVADGPLLTRWAKQVKPDNAHPEHPRPQFERRRWTSLNGLWDYAIRPRDVAAVDQYDGKILVPFPVESALSGVRKPVGAGKCLWYSRELDAPKLGVADRLVLRFEAVDWQATVWVNGKKLGTHEGGYDPFSFDITDALQKQGPQTLVVRVWDPTDKGTQPRGKQVERPRGIWYTAVTGIWQTAWLEIVPAVHIERLKLTPDRSGVKVFAELGTRWALLAAPRVRAIASVDGREVARVEGRVNQELWLRPKEPRLWSPDDPFLYDLRVELYTAKNEPVDVVSSYFGLRTIGVVKDDKGAMRLALNGKVLYQHGPLDQGWWPDGLYTAPTDEALDYDLEVTKKLGFNMVRKHVKVEPQRWYYHCDRLGLLVWQDMPSADAHAPRTGDPKRREIQRSKASAQQFERELRAMIDTHYNSPSIVMWVPFNEGWGQYDTVRITNWIKNYDPSRLVDCASGWNDFPVGDVHDIHRYPGPGVPRPRGERASVLGEFGGLGLPVRGHTWQNERNWGYRTFKDKPGLARAFEQLIGRLRPMIGSGLAASVYTQTTDVEIEVNGLMTYDRHLKLDPERVRLLQEKLYRPPPTLRIVVPTSERSAQVWRYTDAAFDDRDDSWARTDFDDSSWRKGPGGFGTKRTPGAIVGTTWNGPQIRLRRTFALQSTDFAGLRLRIHHDEDARVFLNGKLMAELDGYTTGYVLEPVNPKLLVKGTNVLAIACRQTQGGQFIDAGIVELVEGK